MNATRRELIDIYADILRAIGPGARKSRIVYKANLNFNICKRYLDELLGMGLVEANADPHPTWTVTEGGQEFLEKRRELKGLLSRDRKKGAGTARVRIELDPEAVEKLKDALERAVTDRGREFLKKHRELRGLLPR
ncbi:unnamed protein product [marine sediment metagenome]|uniref:ArnR1-like winged helix-turn-helix domain-containing protein n=1 Tax=marine sediment metagenome TaxID=412755 RepID=X1N0A2_9ZZZZ